MFFEFVGHRSCIKYVYKIQYLFYININFLFILAKLVILHCNHDPILSGAGRLEDVPLSEGVKGTGGRRQGRDGVLPVLAHLVCGVVLDGPAVVGQVVGVAAAAFTKARDQK